MGNLPCLKGTMEKASRSVIFYSPGKWGLFVASAEYPSWSIHTDTSDILSKYSKLLFGLFLQAMAKADKPLIAQADGY